MRADAQSALMCEGVHADGGSGRRGSRDLPGIQTEVGRVSLGDHALEINTKVARITRKGASENRFVAGSIGPTGFLPASTDPTLGDISFGHLVEVFGEQCKGWSRAAPT